MQANNSPCGCCWSFATTAAVECVNALVSGENLALSEQQLIDCDHTGAYYWLLFLLHPSLQSCHNVQCTSALFCPATWYDVRVTN